MFFIRPPPLHVDDCAMSGGGKGADKDPRGGALQSALKSIESTFGAGTVMRLGRSLVARSLAL